MSCCKEKILATDPRVIDDPKDKAIAFAVSPFEEVVRRLVVAITDWFWIRLMKSAGHFFSFHKKQNNQQQKQR
jgi:hypothetical protein